MKYFTIEELYYSNTAKKYNINNTPNKTSTANLIRLAENVLDKAREHFNKPLKVNSGYRSVELNSKVKGASKSQHLKGEAADITFKSIAENKQLFDWIKDNCNYDQLIWEKGGIWIHVSYKASGNRKQVLYL